jgi:hypothetical protein
MSEVRTEVWSQKMSRTNVTIAPELKSLAPTNIKTVHIQTAILKSGSEPPQLDPIEFGWERDEHTCVWFQ